MKSLSAKTLLPLFVFALATVVGISLYATNVRARALSEPSVASAQNVVASNNDGVPDRTVQYPEIANAEARVLALRDQLARAQLKATPNLAVLQQMAWTDLERERSDWESKLATVMSSSYQGVQAEFSSRAVEISNDYLIDNLQLDPAMRSSVLSALTEIEQEKRRLYEELRLGRLTQSEYDFALAQMNTEDIWRESLSDSQFQHYQELEQTRKKQSYLATAVNHASTTTGPMSEQGRELLTSAYAGLIEKHAEIDQSTANPALVYEAMVADYAELQTWLAPQLEGYDHVALDTFLGFRGLELEEAFLEQLRGQSPEVAP